MAVQARLYSEKLGLAMCGSQDWLMSSVLGIDDGLYFNLQEQPQRATQLHQQQGFQSLGINSYQGTFSSRGGDFTSMAFSQSLAALLEKQKQEIDWVLQLQNERLRTTLQDEARNQLAVLLQRCESNMMSLMWKKDEDLAIAKIKTMELEDWLRKIEMENQTWQMKAKENEAKVAALNNTLTQVRDSVPLSSNGAQDAESFCDSSYRENRGDDNKQETREEQSKKMTCKLCNARSSCVVFLPCRHLCSCKSCEAFLGFCPVCESVKEASIEVFLV